jgi:MFS transporter, ACS family, glucarate transporter
MQNPRSIMLPAKAPDSQIGTPGPPTRVRKGVVLLAVILAFLAFLNRACISQVAPAIMRDLHLSQMQMGYVFSIFGLSYAIFEIPSGWLCDRLGAKAVLLRVVLCWSVLTAATGLAWNYASLLIIRLLFGAGEAGCFPALAKVFSTWLPPEERPIAEGWKAAMGRCGAAVAPFLMVILYVRIGWRGAFAIFGTLGVVWAALFSFWYCDRPQDHPAVNSEELRWIANRELIAQGKAMNIRWQGFLTSRSAWALCLQWFCHYYGFYFYLTWLPTYLQRERGIKLEESAILAGMPLLFAGMGTLASGFSMPYLSELIGSSRARRYVSYLSYTAGALLLLLFTFIKSPVLAILVMSLSSFFVELSTPVTWITAMDLGGEAVGTLTGAMNTLGQVGAVAAPTLIACLLAISGNNWTLTFYVSAFIYGMGAWCWTILDPVTRLDGLA